MIHFCCFFFKEQKKYWQSKHLVTTLSSSFVAKYYDPSVGLKFSLPYFQITIKSSGYKTRRIIKNHSCSSYYSTNDAYLIIQNAQSDDVACHCAGGCHTEFFCGTGNLTKFKICLRKGLLLKFLKVKFKWNDVWHKFMISWKYLKCVEFVVSGICINC